MIRIARHVFAALVALLVTVASFHEVLTVPAETSSAAATIVA